MTDIDFRNTNSLWCSVLVETLVRRGVSHAVVSPGSRSTPLTMALARHPRIFAVPVLDERSAGFFALGVAKATGEPVLLVCTSGTAGANYFPAVIEAHESGAPLIVVTADRPPEMRDCASGQTIDQQKLFGGFVTFYHELAVPEARPELLAYLRQTVSHAVDRARAGGVAHLNAPFRDPLPPVPEGGSAAEAVAAVRTGGVVDEAFFETPPAPRAEFPASLELPPDFCRTKGIIVAGAGGGGALEINRLAGALGWPVLADALAEARFGGQEGVATVAAYDAILRDKTLARALRPEAVLLAGELPTSKVLRAWLAEVNAPMIHLTTHRGNRDGLHVRTRRVRVAPQDFQRVSVSKAGEHAGWLDAWMKAEARAQEVLDAGMTGAAAAGFEGAYVRLLAKRLPAEACLFVASSMPVRDLEYFAPVRSRGPRVLASRGANGIDGTLSTALGVAHGQEDCPVVLLTGDLALLHDTNGFLSAGRLRGSLTIVLINNNGGGIFEHLPVAQFDPPFEEYWATPQRVDFATLCAAYGVEHVAVRDGAHFAELAAGLAGSARGEMGVRGAMGERGVMGKRPGAGVRVLEVRTDRKRDTAYRKALLARVAAAAGG
ncbi:2-succinyl-5-enolpyruvyl-6-hydroxy-3-cyclohexene-1-carboxylic-acid synthase [Opitutaceae bacterium TAV1]|nr:2-succinyl-5-enolpyruvyl-6-hydroxy-3-cyclohexene-1-carboxylic-acid synthase [Opitutaceae bacterium TAV1]